VSIINFKEFKEFKELQSREDFYYLYLKTLENSQLEIEINSLIEEFSNESQDKDFFTRGKIILKEITCRTRGSLKIKLENMTKETLKII
jgi:hypothetical protein